MMRRILWALTAVVVATAAGYAYVSWPRQEQALAQDAGARRPPPPVTVEATPVEIDRATVQINAIGSLQSNESVIIRPEISGRVQSLPLNEGDRVRKGQVLVELDASVLRAELAQAEASLRFSRTNNDRAGTLFSQGTGTARARDEALARFQADQAAVELARARLEKATITAPFDGVLGLRSVSVGAYVTPSDRVVNLEDIDPLKVDFRLSEVFLPTLKVGQKINITVDALPGRSFQGEVYAMDPQVDVNGRSIRLRALIPNPDHVLTAGLFARVSVIVAVRDRAVFVPESAIVPQGQDKFVYRIEDDRARFTKVEIGQRVTGRVEILSGLAPDAVVVTAGQLKLRDGAAVEVVAPAGGTGT